tara:strand:+ start:5541 stop:6431 length:891 start_codon:yes stop_codon:yes gene_type:complete
MDDNKILQDLINTLIEDKRSERRYKLIGRILFLSIVLLFIYFASISSSKLTTPHTAIIEINGVIAAGGPVNVKKILPLIENAVDNDLCNGVILKINSPGGSATQSKIIYDEIVKIRNTTSKKIISVIEDVGASGGYYIAASSEEIFSSPSSIVGSIGVRIDSFNIQSLMSKLGIEPQILSSGKDKTILDPFTRLSDKHRKHLQVLLQDIHTQFISDIEISRKDKITTNVYTGLFWTGNEALKIGLVDKIGSIYDANKEIFNDNPMVTYNRKENLLTDILNTSLFNSDYTNNISIRY